MAILGIVVAFLAFSLAARPAFAVDRRVELAARDALRRAEQEFAISDYDKAIGRLERALRGCSSSKCGPGLKAQLWRDLGTMQIRKGEKDDAIMSFGSALKLQPGIDLNPAYEADDTRALFEAARDLATATGAVQPTGDFEHTPASEQAVHTPLPVYVEFSGTTPPAQVVVKYKSSAMTTWKRAPLARVKGSSGWGGLIPCGSMTLGVMHYYVQGFDAHGDPAFNSGDPKRPYLVPVRPSISSEAPHLPNTPAPQRCSEAEALAPVAGEAPTPVSLQEDGGECASDAQCKSEVCEQNKCAARAHKRAGGRQFARIWIGASGSVDALTMPSANDVCLRNAQGQPVNSAHYYCTDPNAGDYPKNTTQNSYLSPGSAGHADGGIHSGDVRALLMVDYAATGNLLVGVRFGYVLQRYPGSAAVSDGRAFGLPLHFEGRVTYVFGEDPLVRSGFAPYGFAALGVAPFDASQTVMITESSANGPVAGQRPLLAWVTGGPFFIAAGGGARYAFSARAAFLMGLKLTGAIGGSGLLPTVEPELGVQLGF
jgi:hypothetical protein